MVPQNTDADPVAHLFPQHGFTPLHLACGLGLKSVVKALLDLGANPEATDSVRTNAVMPPISAT